MTDNARVPSLNLVVATVAALALFGVGLRRVPRGHAAVLVIGSCCRRLPAPRGWTWVPAGLGHLALVDLSRLRVLYGPTWHQLPTGERLRLEVMVGLTVMDPGPLAAESLRHPVEVTTAVEGPVGLSLNWVDETLRAAIPALLSDVMPAREGRVDLAVEPPRWWPLLRVGLMSVFSRHGLLVQEVWVREFDLDPVRATAPGAWDCQGVDTSM